jgi:DNA repair protein RadC
MVHNHPSGQEEPSELDQEITDRIGLAGGYEYPDDRSRDHYQKRWYSFAKEDLIRNYADDLLMMGLGA